MIREAEAQGDIHGINICRRALPISQLFFFTDDNILFNEASMSESEKIKQILNYYKLASRQKINYEKSTITISRNTPPYVCY